MVAGRDFEAGFRDQLSGSLTDRGPAVDVVLAPDEVDRRRDRPELVVGEMILRPPASESQREVQVGPHGVAPTGHAHPGRDHVAELVRRPIEGCLPDDALHGPADGLCRVRGRNDPRRDAAKTRSRQQREEGIAPHARQRHRRHTDADHRGHALRCVKRHAERPHSAQRSSDERRALELQRVQHRRELRPRVRTKRPAGVRLGVAQTKPGEVDRDGPAVGQVSHHRRPRRSRHAAAVDEYHGVSRAGLAHFDRERRILERQPPALGAEPVHGEEATLGVCEDLSGGHPVSLPGAASHYGIHGL